MRHAVRRSTGFAEISMVRIDAVTAASNLEQEVGRCAEGCRSVVTD